MKYTIQGSVPSQKNSKQIFINKRTGKPFITSSKNVKQWQKDALWQLKGKSAVTVWPALCEMEFFVKDKRKRDLDNMATTVLDILKKAGLIPDDSYNFVNPLCLYYNGIDNDPRVEITIEEG